MQPRTSEGSANSAARITCWYHSGKSSSRRGEIAVFGVEFDMGRELSAHSKVRQRAFSHRWYETHKSHWLTRPHVARNFRALFSTVKTFSAKASEVPRRWWVIDAQDQVLGRVAVKAANLLRGKGKTVFTPHVDTGDFVIVINAEKVRLTGKKEEQKSYMSFSGYVGGHKSENVRARRDRHPELLVERAVRGMIPHNRLGRHIYRKLKVYRGDSHPHAAQQPEAVKI